MKVAIYARYSSDDQRDASIADQLRICREFAARQGWTVVQEFSDHAISGATRLRSGFQALMRDALNRRFDVVLAESLDRFSRDQEDTAGLFKRLTFAGVNIVTLAEGDITHLHIGFKGTMYALFLRISPRRLTADCVAGSKTESRPAASATAIASSRLSTAERLRQANGKSSRARPLWWNACSANSSRACRQSKSRRTSIARVCQVRSVAPGVRARSTAMPSVEPGSSTMSSTSAASSGIAVAM
jgi:Resolvase, N terminal domain